MPLLHIHRRQLAFVVGVKSGLFLLNFNDFQPKLMFQEVVRIEATAVKVVDRTVSNRAVAVFIRNAS